MRFYGGDPMRWLERTPSVVVQACLTMLPRLQAEESIASVNDASIAGGHVTPEHARSVVMKLQQQALGSAAPAARPERRDPSELRQRGFAVKRVPKRKAS